MLHKKVQAYIAQLNLLPHPEGGYFKETYRSPLTYENENFNAPRNLSTGIYFLLTEDNFSAFHRIKSDEMWHFYDGDTLLVHIIHPDGQYACIQLGKDIENGEQPQAVVPANSWFASESKGNYSLVGCTVAPGFDFDDFEMAQKVVLSKQFPAHQDLIERLCRS
jgi:predicted cupin superfamily sugar epimerase